jgi:hypothetical protein
MKLKIKEGTTSKIVHLFIKDSTSGSESGLTGLTSATSGLTGYWIASGDPAATAISFSPATVGTYTSGGFVAVPNMAGVYEFGIPDSAIDASSEGSVMVMLSGAANMEPVVFEIELDKIDYRSEAYLSLESSARTIVTGVAVAGTLSTTQMTTDLTEETDDHYNGRVLIFTDGGLAGQATSITDYVGYVGGVTPQESKLVFRSLTQAPVAGSSKFVIV